MKLRPDNFQNPYPAYSSEFPGRQREVTVAQIAVQYHPESGASAAAQLSEEIRTSLGGDSGPWRSEPCTHVDNAGFCNEIFIAYWDTRKAFLTWKSAPRVREWLESVHDVGHWLESFTCPLEQMETSYSNNISSWGLAGKLPKRLESQHSYFGAMRDRIEAAEDGGLPGVPDYPAPGDSEKDTSGRRQIVTLPENLCFIRTTQGWKNCTAEQEEDFLKSIFPIYRTGSEYLRDNPRESNCVSSRLVELTAADSQIQTQTLAWFLSLADLERWAHRHPTHLAILKGFGDFAERHNLEIDVLLGHEVFVLPSAMMNIEYSNCHAQTGFLRFFPSQEIREG